jgi:hypothetical protein
MRYHKADGTQSRAGATCTRRSGASANRRPSPIGLPLLACLPLLALLAMAAASSAAFAQASDVTVTTVRVYRAIDSRLLGGSMGNAGTLLGNTNAASAGGVLGYLHSEVIPSFAVPRATGRRHNGIDAIAVFEVQVLNVRRARLSKSSDPPGMVNAVGPFMAFNGGEATPPNAREQIATYGAYVGVQDQTRHPRHAYPGDWYSFVGVCPFSRWGTGANGNRGKPSPCPTTPVLDGICDAATPAGPDGTPLCQYTYTYLGYVPIDDLVGITSKSEPRCATNGAPRPCADFGDFRANGGVEYSAGPDVTVDCADDQSPETGLPFWRGRCDPERARARMRALANWSPLVVPGVTTTGPSPPRQGS